MASSNHVDTQIFRNKTISRNFVGFGGQYNQYVYAELSQRVGTTPENLPDMEQKVIDLGCQHVRIFFDNADLDPITYPERADRFASFLKTVQLAQKSGATMNITYWYGPYTQPKKQMDQFADLLFMLREKLGCTGVQYITIQNEPILKNLPLSLYHRLYRNLHNALIARGIRDKIKFIGGDLLLPQQEIWFKFMAKYMAEILDGYSSHIYWQLPAREYAKNRLEGILAINRAMPKDKQKPLYLTEFGMRADLQTFPRPGFIDGVPTGDTLINAFQHAWFELETVKSGFVTVLKWDIYGALYEEDLLQDHSVITKADRGYMLRPVFYQLKLLTHTTKVGWDVYEVQQQNEQKQVVAMGKGNELTVFALNDSENNTPITIGGLPKSHTFNLYYWNQKGDGQNSFAGSIQTNEKGEISIDVPFQSFAALTTLNPTI